MEESAIMLSFMFLNIISGALLPRFKPTVAVFDSLDDGSSNGISVGWVVVTVVCFLLLQVNNESISILIKKCDFKFFITLYEQFQRQ
jgi:hypothetical protein